MLRHFALLQVRTRNTLRRLYDTHLHVATSHLLTSHRVASHCLYVARTHIVWYCGLVRHKMSEAVLVRVGDQEVEEVDLQHM